MLLSGIVLALVGAVAIIYSMAQRSTGEYLLASAFGTEEAAAIDAILYIGIAVLVVGVILLIIDYLKKNEY